MPKVENCGEKKGRIVEEGGKNEEKKRKRGIWGQDWEFEEKHIIEYRGKGKPIHMPALQHAEGAKKLSEVGFEPTPSLEDQNLSLAP